MVSGGGDRPEGLVGVADAIELLRAELEQARDMGTSAVTAARRRRLVVRATVPIPGWRLRFGRVPGHAGCPG